MIKRFGTGCKMNFDSRWRLLFILLISWTLVSAKSGPGRTLLFDEGWKFHLGNAADPAKDFNYRIANIYAKSGDADNSAISPGFNDDDWKTVQLPHDWVVALPFVFSTNEDVESHGYKPVGGFYPENSIGWYRKHFTIDEKDKGKRISIRFDGVFRDAKFWINGFYLGENESGYMGVSYDLTDFIELGKDNVIVVRVDASQYEGWFYEGAGIYRHVWLSSFHDIHLAENGIFIHSDIADKKASVTIETTIENQGHEGVSCSLTAIILDRNGKAVCFSQDQKVTFSSSGTERTKQVLEVNDPRIWKLDDPYLYKAIVLVRTGSGLVDSNAVRFGIRSIRFDPDKGLFLNDINVKVLGVCCHQDHAGVGSAVPDGLVYYRLRLLKEMGVNAYRTSHNPPAPELLDACDSLGILVLDETRLLNSGSEYLSQFEKLILRDRNHPSVFLWSIGNEEGYIQTKEVGKRFATTFLERQRELDPTRFSTYAADLPNVYKGINEVIPVRGFNYRHFAVADYHKSHPTQPIIGTEMGSTVSTRGIYLKDTVKCLLIDEDLFAPWWASTAETWWKLCAAQPWWMGGFVWTGFDYRGEPTPYKWPDVASNFGLMDVCGFPKNVYYYYQSWWTNKDVLQISPHWNWKGQEGKRIQVWVNSNADNVELFLNDKSLGKKVMERNGHLIWEVPFYPGLLKAVAFRNGKKIETQIETTGDPYQVILEPDRMSLKANNQDVIVVNVSVKDKENRVVPDAMNLIRFSLKGDATILGVGNGDPCSHEPDQCTVGQWQRNLFNGKCQLILRSGKTSGKVVVEARSEGISDGSLQLEENQ